MAYYARGGQYPFFTVLRRSITAETPLEHNFRYPRIRELMYMGGALALGAPRTF